MTQIRNGLPPVTPYVGGSDVTTMIQQLSIELESSENHARDSAREAAADMREAHRDELRSMRREANAALVSGIVSGAAKITQAVGSLTTRPAEDTNRSESENETTAAPTGARKALDVFGAASSITTTITDRIGADAAADRVAAKLEASTAEDARDAARAAAKGAHDTIDHIRTTASEIARTRAETMRRVLA